MTDLKLFRIYEPHELGPDGYPRPWHSLATHDLLEWCAEHGSLPDNKLDGKPRVGVKDLVRAEAGHRCVRCGHPYLVGQGGVWERTGHITAGAPTKEDIEAADWDDKRAQPAVVSRHGTHWSACDEHCTHGGPLRWRTVGSEDWYMNYPNPAHKSDVDVTLVPPDGAGEIEIQAAWRILTVHHLNERKYDLRWWNLASLCQRCHLRMQTSVQMERVYLLEHSEWFKPYAAGWYAYAYLQENLTREETMERLDELLALEQA